MTQVRKLLHLIRKMLGYIRRGETFLLKAYLVKLVHEARSFGGDARVENISCSPIKSDELLVSVVIPCFNYGQFVTEAVDSVLNQTLSDVEIIVVDGGSDDLATLEVLRALKRPRTRVIFRDGRHLVGDNRNFGIEQAKGRYICCLDADDTLESTYLEKAVFMLEMYGYDVTSTALRLTGARSGTIGILPVPDLQAMVEGNHVHTCAVFRRTLWEQAGGYFDAGLGREHVAEDWDLWVRLAAMGARIRNIVGEPLLNYRTHVHGSLSSSANVKPVVEQRQAIWSRNRALLTPQAFRRSSTQRRRKLQALVSQLNLTRSMKNRGGPGSPTLMLALPFMLVGGAERLFSNLTQYLVGRGWRVIVVSTNEQSTDHGDAIQWFKQHTSEVYALPRFLAPDEFRDFVEYLVLSRRPDCLLTAGSQLFYQWLPALCQLNPNMAVVDMLFNPHGHTASHLRCKSFYTFGFAENEEVMEWYRGIGWEQRRIRKLTSGISLDTYQPSAKPAELLNRYAISADDLVVGFSGRLSPEKGPDVFVEIARLCQGVPNLHFVMAGGGPMKEELNALAARLPLNVRFHLIGVVEDIRPYLALYDILVLPSRLDGRPVGVLESLASGVPVLASRVGGVPELVNDGVNGYMCSPAVASEFAGHICSLANDRAKLARLKVGARIFSEKHLDEKLHFAVYETALRDAISYQQSRAGIAQTETRGCVGEAA